MANQCLTTSPPRRPARRPLRATACERAAVLAKLSRATKIILATTLVAAVAIGGYLAYRSANEPYGVSVPYLERDDAAALVARLRASPAPSLRARPRRPVPAARVHELRLELASAGLPYMLNGATQKRRRGERCPRRDVLSNRGQGHGVRAVVAVHRDPSALGDESHDGVTGHRRTAPREVDHDVVESFDVDAGACVESVRLVRGMRVTVVGICSVSPPPRSSRSRRWTTARAEI